MAGPHDLLYHATLSPHRSLTRRQARGIVLLVGCVTTALSVPFTVMGAWPVVGFLGLDVAALAFAFSWSFRAARAYEDVAVTPLELMLAKVSPSGERREWRFNPLWVRLVRKDHEEYGLVQLALASRDRHVEVGAFLGPEARDGVARELRRALTAARRGPQFEN